ncbi:MAG TPA: hypothetical protein VF755_16205 [Catenuloplanes sp.]|jgi:pimeloyl-ACP methyl ester carboxylesterase
MATIIGVHGIAQQQLGRRQLLELWQPALGDGLERHAGPAAELPDLDIVFYGDLFLPGENGGSPNVPPAKGGPGQGGDWFDDLDEQEAAELAEAAGEIVSDEDIAEAAATPAKADIRLPRPLQAVVGAIGRRFGSAAVVLFFGDLRQVRRYLREPGLKATVDGRVAAAVSPGCRVLVGHSLGSVVAYEYVRRHPDADLPLLLTLGSPLGLKMVRRWLPAAPTVPSALTVPSAPPGGGLPGGLPPGVRRWVNVYDKRDPVACAGPLYRWWPGVDDADVTNESDAHEVTRYLGKRVTGAAIVAALREPA